MTPTTAFIPHIRPDESPLSLLQRAALGNGWESLKQACNSMFVCAGDVSRFVYSALRYRNRYLTVAERLGVRPDDAKAIVYDRVTSTIQSKVIWRNVAARSTSLRFTAPQYCPHCLLESRYGRDLWTHRLVSACVKHQCWLIDRSCKPDSCPINPLDHDWPSEQDLQVLCLDSEPAPPIVINTMSVLQQNTDSELLERLETCLDLSSRWADWGLLAEDHRSISVAACEFFAGRWPQTIRNQSSNAPGDNRHPAHPRCLVSELMASDVPSHQHLASEVLRNAPLELPMVCFGNDDFITRALAKKILGMNIGEVDVLAERGVVARGERGFTIASCSALLCRLESMPQPIPPLAGISRALRQWKQKSTSGLIGDLLDGTISACCFDRSIGINSLQIQASDLPQREACTEFLLLEDVADLCGVHTECIRFISSRTPLLRSVEKSGRTAKYRFRKQDVAAFHATYVFAGALAGELKVGRTTLAAKLQSAGLTPVSGPRIDGGLTFLFRREDLKSIDLDAVAHSVDYATNAGRKPDGFVAQDLPGLPLQTAADRLEISLQSCRYLLSKDMLVRVPHLGRGLLVSEQSVADLRALYSEPLLTTREAGKRFRQTASQFSATWVHTGQIKKIVLPDRAGFLPHDLERLLAQLGDQIIPSVWCREHGFITGHARNRFRHSLQHDGMATGQPRAPFLIAADQVGRLSEQTDRLRSNIIR